MKPINIIAAFFLLPVFLCAQVVKEKPIKKCPTAFAIFVDSKTFEKTKNAIYQYRDAVENDGLSTYIFSADWKNPDQIRKELQALYKADPSLEGIVLVGDIPVALVRNAQHLTTAFKMDELRFPMAESSVPSDRFYDDLHLSFDFIARDSVQPLHFYYKLCEYGPQDLKPTFYSARIRYPEKRGGDKYQAISDFLIRAAVAKAEKNNRLDCFVSFTGSAYNSECLVAWMDEMKAYRENFPLAWTSSQSAKQLNFRMDNYMKYKLFDQLQRPEVDLFMFHEHGMPEEQLINNNAPGSSFESRYENVRSDIYSMVRRKVSRQKASPDSVRNEMAKKYGLQKNFFDKFNDPALLKADSISQADTYINLTDLKGLNTYPRFVMLDACYNGSFHLDDYVAGYYIFNRGKTLVVQGNSRNVLQDRWTIEMIGLLSYGVRVGTYNRMVATLEGHLMGDPTVRYASVIQEEVASGITLKAGNDRYWKQGLSSEFADIQSLSLRMLADNDTAKVLSPMLLKTFKTSAFNTVRMEALRLLSRYANKDFTDAVALGLYDPYELIARQSASYAGRIGSKELLLPLADVFINYDEKQRVSYNVFNALGLYPADQALEAIQTVLYKSSHLDKEKELEEIKDGYMQRANNQKKSHTLLMNSAADPQKRIMEIRSVRNYNYHFLLNDYLTLLSNPKENLSVRETMAEALGWFDNSYRKEEIVQACHQILKENNIAPTLKNELIQTINRLK